MIYYAVVYMKNGEIHLKPFNTKEEAQERIDAIKNHEKWKSEFLLGKIVKKDPESPWYQSVHGYWI